MLNAHSIPEKAAEKPEQRRYALILVNSENNAYGNQEKAPRAADMRKKPAHVLQKRSNQQNDAVNHIFNCLFSI